MKTLCALILLAVFVAVPITAQSIDHQPQYFLAIGGGVKTYSTPYSFAYGSFGAKIADATWSMTTIEMTAVSSSTRTGIARALFQQGPVTLGVLGDIGASTNDTGNVGLALSGAGFVDVQIKKLPGVSITATARMLKTAVQDPLNSGGIKPIFTGGLTYSFGK